MTHAAHQPGVDFGHTILAPLACHRVAIGKAGQEIGPKRRH
jgi:hypothetical protein